VNNLANFDILSLITKLGEAVLKGGSNASAPAPTENGEKGFSAPKAPNPPAAPAAPSFANGQPPRTVSTSEKALVEALRRHDKKAREIDEKAKSAQKSDSDKKDE